MTLILTAVLLAQGLDPKALLKPPIDTWPTYNGDYSGRRFSPLTEINSSNLDSLALEWFYRISSVGQQRGVGAPAIKSTPLLVNGILYFTIPDHVFALDARTGEEIWHYSWQDQGGHLVGNRGLGMYRDWLYFMTPDCWFISLSAKDGKERWRKHVADEKMQYFCTMSPLVVKNHILVGVGGDAMDVPGFLESRDPETGELQWHWNSTPRKGEPGSETWPNPNAMEHGGGMTWMPGTYDPDLNLLYWGTGNPNPVFAGQGRKGSNLYTASIVALNPDSGKLVWYFQPSPHDTHDFDNVETPVLFDGLFNGKQRKMLAQAARNGIFSVLDRATGESLLTKGFVKINWMKGLDAKGQPIPDPAKEPKVDGSLISMPGGGATNWPAPSYSPDSGLFYVNAKEGYSITYLTDDDPEPQGYGGGGAGGLSEPVLLAIDYKTGKVAWKHNYPSGGFGNAYPGVLTTAGKLLFTGDPSGNLLAFDPGGDRILWSFRVGAMVSNGPSTYMLNGSQHLIVGAGDTLFSFKILKKGKQSMTRRELLGSALFAATQLKAAPNPLRNIGGAPAGFPIRSRAARAAGQTFDFVDHCHSLGLGVVETRLPQQGTPAEFRRKVESYGMRVILDVGFPRDESGVAAFDANVKTAKECGAISLHAAMTGRRYEDFTSFDAFKQNFAKNQKSVELAEPILRKHKLPLGLENHKGWRSAEQAAWLKRVSSEWVGVHFDYGNNISLCEPPAETLKNLLPFTIACHLKDMAVQPYEDGFLLSEVPLGEGLLDLKGMTAQLLAKDRNMPLSLEMITRDPLKVPILTDAYWVTFDDPFSPISGHEMARMFNLVRKNPPKSPLPRTADLSPEAQLKLEDECIVKSIAYARQHLTS